MDAGARFPAAGWRDHRPGGDPAGPGDRGGGGGAPPRTWAAELRRSRLRDGRAAGSAAIRPGLEIGEAAEFHTREDVDDGPPFDRAELRRTAEP